MVLSLPPLKILIIINIVDRLSLPPVDPHAAWREWLWHNRDAIEAVRAIGKRGCHKCPSLIHEQQTKPVLRQGYVQLQTHCLKRAEQINQLLLRSHRRNLCHQERVVFWH